jgi:lipoprotein-releasing system permease protein
MNYDNVGAMFRTELVIAQRYLRSGASRRNILSFTTWMSVLGVAIGVAATCLVTGVFNGFMNRLREAVVAKMGDFVVLHSRGRINHVTDIQNQLRPVLPSGTMLEPLGYTEGMVAARGAGFGVNMEGVSDEGWERVHRFIVKEVARPKDQPFEVWIGETLADRLRVKPGDDIQLVLPGITLGTERGLPQSRRFRLTGVFSVGMQDYDGKVVLLPLPVLRKWAGWDFEASFMRVRLPPGADFDKAEKILKEKLPNPYVYKTWYELHRNYFTSIVIEKYFLTIVVGVTVFISLFNVVSTLYLLMSDKIRDMSMLRAMGATRGFLQRVFVACGFLFGAIGATLGLFLACFLAWLVKKYPIVSLPRDIYNLSHLPVAIRPLEWGALWLLTIVAGTVAAALPSLRARRLSPVEGLRYE